MIFGFIVLRNFSKWWVPSILMTKFLFFTSPKRALRKQRKTKLKLLGEAYKFKIYLNQSFVYSKSMRWSLQLHSSESYVEPYHQFSTKILTRIKAESERERNEKKLDFKRHKCPIKFIIYHDRNWNKNLFNPTMSNQVLELSWSLDWVKKYGQNAVLLFPDRINVD